MTSKYDREVSKEMVFVSVYFTHKCFFHIKWKFLVNKVEMISIGRKLITPSGREIAAPTVSGNLVFRPLTLTLPSHMQQAYF